MKVVKDIMEDDTTEKIIIGIGSAQYSRTSQNPLTFSERKEMIRIALKDAGIPQKAYELIAIPDIHNDSLWVGHVESTLPKFDIIYTGNPLVKDLFQKAGHIARDIVLYKDINSTTVRKMMAQGMKSEWKKRVPNAVAYYLDDIDAEKILKNIKDSQDSQSTGTVKEEKV